VPAVGGCWPDDVEPAAPAAAAPWSDLPGSLAGAGEAGFGALAPRRALREDVLFAVVLFVEESAEGEASAGALVFGAGAGATPLSCGTGTGAAALGGAADVSGDVPAAGGFADDGFGAGGGADEVVWSVTPGVTGGGAFWSCAAEYPASARALATISTRWIVFTISLLRRWSAGGA